MLVAAFLCLGQLAWGGPSRERGFVDRILSDDDGDHRYVVFVPQGEPPAEGWPVVLFLHSAGERGTDGRKQVENGIGPAVRQRAESFGGVVVFPQAAFADGPILETWRAAEPGGRLALAALADVERHWPIDPDRRALTGWSMGAYGALSLAADDPAHWSKVLAISGGGEHHWVKELTKLPVWLIHGSDDAIVPVTESRRMRNGFRKLAADDLRESFTFNEVPRAGHNLWRSVYATDAVLSWLLASKAASPPDDVIAAPPPIEQTPPSAGEGAFDPALIVSGAMSLRLGNEALATISDGIPAAMREKGLKGKLKPVSDRVEFDDRTFDVRFTNMAYNGRVDRAVLQGHGADRLQLRFGLRDLEVRIGQIEVSDASERVAAGPVSVIIGHREPVWMNLEVRPVATPRGQLKLWLLRSQLTIPDFNWYVKPPERIDIRGQLFTPEVVRTAIVGGVYQRKDVIEEKILGAVGPILRTVERRIDFSPLGRLMTSLWPLPVYRPRLEMLLEETSTDREGVSLVFGCAVAGLEMSNEKPPVRHVRASSPAAHAIAHSNQLEAGIAMDVIQHLAALAAGTNAASLYTADVPGRPFEDLDDVDLVLAALPDGPPVESIRDVRCRLMLDDPFEFAPRAIDGLRANPAKTASVGMSINVPGLTMTVFGKQRSNSRTAQRGEWITLAEQQLMISQPIRLTTTTSVDGPTVLSVQWDDAAQVTVASGDPVSQSSSDLTTLFRRGWARWSDSQRREEKEVPDLLVGTSLLRLEQFCWEGNCLRAELLPARTVLVNDSRRPIDVCVRRTHSPWSDPLTIAPGQQHVFRTGTRLEIRDAARWTRTGQPLTPGIYHWSAADETGQWLRIVEPSAEP